MKKSLSPEDVEKEKEVRKKYSQLLQGVCVCVCVCVCV